MSERKFSKSLSFWAPQKGLGLNTCTFVGAGYEVDGVLYNAARNVISFLRDPTYPKNSSIFDLIMVVK